MSQRGLTLHLQTDKLKSCCRDLGYGQSMSFWWFCFSTNQAAREIALEEMTR